MKAQSTVACELHLRKRGLTVDALGEDAPGDFLGNGCLGGFLAERLVDELPRFFSAIQIPDATAFTGNDDLNVGSRLCGNAPVCERQSAQKTIQDRIVKLARHDARLVHCQPDLLLVMPEFRELPRRVEPICRFLFASPAYTVRSHRLRIAGSVQLRQ